MVIWENEGKFLIPTNFSLKMLATEVMNIYYADFAEKKNINHHPHKSLKIREILQISGGKK